MSSRIENTQSGLQQLFLFEADQTEIPHIPDVKEVINYVNAMEYGIERLKHLPMSTRLLCEIHEILMEGVRGEKATPGLMRNKQNWIGKPNSTLMDATYIPPPVQEMKDCFSELEKYIHSTPKELTLIQCALIHYQFEAIHPFVDGNGRIGRLLIALMLIERGGLSQPLLYLSDFFERYRDTYYELLLNVSQKGEWEAWLKFFLDGVCQQSEDALSTVQKLLILKDEYEEIAREQKVSKTVNQMIEVLFGKPIVSISELMKSLDTSYPTIKRGVDYLIKKGKLTEVTGKQRNRLYAANEILGVITTERTEALSRKPE